MNEQIAGQASRIVTAKFDPHKTDPKDFRESRIKMVMRQMPLVLLADIIAGSFLFLILASMSVRPVGFVWCGVLLFTSVVRLLIVDYFKKQADPVNSINTQSWFLFIGVGLSALIWGSAFVMIPPDATLVEKGLVVLWLGGMLAGAASTLSIIPGLFFMFAVPSASLLGAYLVYQGGPNDLALINGLAMYLLFMFPIAFRISNDLNYGIKLKLHNLKLQDLLKEEEDGLKRKESELLKQVLLAQSLRSENTYAHEMLREADDKYLRLLDSMDEGIFGLDPGGKISFINRSALDLLKLESKDVLGLEALALINKRSRNMEPRTDVQVAIRGCLHQGTACHHLVSSFTRGDRDTVSVRFSCRPIIRDGIVEGAVVNFSDITQQKEMEAALMKAQKMEAIGRITGGVAHDFNNLLTVIIGNLQFLRKRLTTDDKIRSSNLINKITNAAKSGAELNNRLLSFTRDQTLLLEPQDINEVLKEIGEFVHRILGERIEMDLRLTDKPCVAMTDRGQLENAIVNLCVNARDAMPEGGKLTISTQRVNTCLPFERDNKSSRLRDFIIIEVADTGIGIPVEVKEQIFDPFFTTKKGQQRTGLGLSTVYGFMRQSDGDITVESEVGKGACFRMYLPASTLSVASDDAGATDVATQHKVYSGTILVVEDDTGVRDVASQMLMETGFKVIAVSNGADALEYVKRSNRIDLVFSDIVMPGEIDGIELAKRLLVLKPSMPVLLATGYTDRLQRDNIPRVKNVISVGKPYDIDRLPALINSLIVNLKDENTA